MSEFKNKVQNWLAEWAEFAVEGEVVNGYASEAPLLQMVVGGSFSQSRPLIQGELCSRAKKIDRIFRQVEKVSPLTIARMKCAFYPGKHDFRVRAEAAGCSLSTMKRVVRDAVDTLVLHAREID